MKFKQTVLLATFVVTMGLLLGTSAAQAAEVTFGTVITDKAIGITNLDIGGTFYNVLFDEQTPAVGVYGALPGDFDFTTDVSAEAAANAVNAALNGANAQLVGEDTPLDNRLSLFFHVGYGSAVTPPPVAVAFVWTSGFAGGGWGDPPRSGLNQLLYNGDERTYATFTVAGLPDPVSIGGTVTGLESNGLVLQNNGGDDLTIAAADIVFEFAARVNVGDPYEVTVFTQPEGQICSVTNGSDVAPDVDVTNVEVDCVNEPDQVTIGGRVFGLESGSVLLLQNNDTDYLLMSENGEFIFDDSLTPGDPYDVTVFTQPEGQTCSVRNGNGVAPDVDVTNVFVFCGDEPDPVTIGGGVFGLESGSVLLLGNNDTDYLLMLDNGEFIFDDSLMPGDPYDVSVFFVYPEQICSVPNGSGVAPDVDVTNVAVACGPAAEPVTIGGTVTGLESDSGLVLQNNLTDDKPIAADGEFTFDEPLQPGGTYSVTVLTNPTNPAQECFVVRGDGAVPYEDVTNVAVTCAPSDDGPAPPEPHTVCERDACEFSEELQDECNLFMDQCLEDADTIFQKNQCYGGGFLMCGE